MLILYTSTKKKLMKNNLYEKQSADKFLNLFAATSQVYDEGKRSNTILLLVTLIGAIFLPIFLLFFNNFADSLSWIVGAIGVIVTLYIGSSPKKKKEIGAKIQEQFDTELYGLSWNEDLVGPPMDKNYINEKAMKFGADKIESLKNNSPNQQWKWYGDYSNLDTNHAVLYCQKENLYWDQRQKGEYARFLGWCAFGVIIFGILLYAFYAQSKGTIDLFVYLKEVLFVQSPLLVHLISMFNQNRTNSIKLGSEMEHAQRIQEEHKDSDSIDNKVLRSVQDTIYRNRSTGMLVPTWYYKWKTKKKFQKVLDKTAKDANQLPETTPTK